MASEPNSDPLTLSFTALSAADAIQPGKNLKINFNEKVQTSGEDVAHVTTEWTISGPGGSLSSAAEGAGVLSCRHQGGLGAEFQGSQAL